jgi:hypothetical protein
MISISFDFRASEEVEDRGLVDSWGMVDFWETGLAHLANPNRHPAQRKYKLVVAARDRAC